MDTHSATRLPQMPACIMQLDAAEQALHRAISWRAFAPRAIANAHIRDAIAEVRNAQRGAMSLAIAA